MSFPQRLKAARLAAGRSQQEIADALGVDKTTYSGYETGRRQPDLFRLRRLSPVLEYSADQLLELGPAGAPSPEEWERVKKYRLLDAHGRELVDMVLDKEYSRMAQPGPAEEPDSGWVTYINCYDLAVSAGPGEPWSDAGYKTRLEIPGSQVPENAHFCVRVNGDSMEPAYKDGDIVFVQRVEGCVQVGETGIFFLNGDGYIKRLGLEALESLNPRYAPIPLCEYDDLRCQGRVLGKLAR